MEIYKLAKGISPTITQEIFRFCNKGRYNSRGQITFAIPFRNSVYNSTESVSYMGLNLTSLSSFKYQRKKWNPKNCSTLTQDVGFIN